MPPPTPQYAGINLHTWLGGFASVADSVRSGVDAIAHHPLVPPTVPVHGLIIDPLTGKLDLVVDGSDTVAARARKRMEVADLAAARQRPAVHGLTLTAAPAR